MKTIKESKPKKPKKPVFKIVRTPEFEKREEKWNRYRDIINNKVAQEGGRREVTLLEEYYSNTSVHSYNRAEIGLEKDDILFILNDALKLGEARTLFRVEKDKWLKSQPVYVEEEATC